MLNNVLIIGSNGFVGKNIKPYLDNIDNISVKTSSHQVGKADFCINPQNVVKSASIIKKFDVIIFCPAYFSDSKESRAINYEFPLNFFKLANTVGVKKFIFLSTTLVAKEMTQSEIDKIVFQDSYVEQYPKYKAKAEISLNQINGPTNLIILRLSHIYNNEITSFKGIFRFILKLQKLKFLILPNIKVKKSLLHIDNLKKLLLKIIYSHNISGTYYVNDGVYYDLIDISRYIAKCNGNSKIYHFRISTKLFRFFSLFFISKYPQLKFYARDLMFSSKKTQDTFKWNPEAEIINK